MWAFIPVATGTKITIGTIVITAAGGRADIVQDIMAAGMAIDTQIIMVTGVATDMIMDAEMDATLAPEVTVETAAARAGAGRRMMVTTRFAGAK